MSNFILFSEAFREMIDNLVNPIPSTQMLEWRMFNEATGGFRPNEFSILCGPTGKGKTTLLANMSAQLLKANTKHCVMPIETGAADFVARVISVFEMKDINDGKAMDKNKAVDISIKHADLVLKENLLLSPHEDRVKVEKLIFDLQEAHEHGCKVVFIDNLNFLLEVVSAQNAIIEMDRVVHELIMFVKRTPIHIVMVMHPKKTEDGRINSEFDIKGSSTSVQEAQNVFLFNGPSNEQLKSGDAHLHDRFLKIAKMRRRGKFVGSEIKFENFEGKYTEAP